MISRTIKRWLRNTRDADKTEKGRNRTKKTSSTPSTESEQERVGVRCEEMINDDRSLNTPPLPQLEVISMGEIASTEAVASAEEK